MRAIARQMAVGFMRTMILIIVAVAMGSVPAQAQGTTVYAQYTGTPVVVDGQLDAAWAYATPYPLAYTYGTSNFNPPTGACNAVPTMRAMWDGNLLYVLIAVTDPYVSGNSTFAGDAAEFWADHFNDKVQKFEEDDSTFVISAPNSSGTVATSSNGTNAGDNIYPNLANRYLAAFKSALQTNGSAVTGYNVEFAWYIGDHVSAIGNHASLNGLSIGFDVTVYEAPGPTGSTRTCRLMLSPADANRTTNNNQPWGTITLTGYDPATSAPMQPDTFLLGVNIGAARAAAQVLPAGTTGLPAVTNKATWAMAAPGIWTDTTALSSDLTAATAAMSSTDQSVIDSANSALDADLHNLRRNGPYPYGGGPFPDAYDLPSINCLNDPFLFMDGSRVNSLANWSRRQAEIKTLAQYL